MRLVYLFSLSFLTIQVIAQAPWSGNMHPLINFPSNCSLEKTNDCAPSYSTLETNNALWTCPDGTESPLSCGAGGCIPGEGDNPLCMHLNSSYPCCCPKNGCYTTPSYNWIIGVCKGNGCACGANSTRANSCAPQNKTNQCSNDCTGPSVPCCFGNDVSSLMKYYEEGTHAKVNYIASYQYNTSLNQWVLQEESSFNTDGKYPTYDLLLPYGGLEPSQAWLSPQPGGSVFWSLGYYPAGVAGVGPPGSMFVLSTEDWFAGTWYMLNQLTLDRGPGVGYPEKMCSITNDNCWASGNAGEMDFLEPGWNNPSTALLNYTQSFSTQNNQVGRCFNEGINSGGFGSDNYLLTEPSPIDGGQPEPIVYVAVVDQVGIWVYRIPSTEIETIWPGLSRKYTNTYVQSAPNTLPTSVNPCVGGFCYTFTSNCQATTYTDALKQNCGFNGQQGFCGNVFSLMVDTKQPLFPSANCTKDIRGGVEMPWCECMVNGKNC